MFDVHELATTEDVVAKTVAAALDSVVLDHGSDLGAEHYRKVIALAAGHIKDMERINRKYDPQVWFALRFWRSLAIGSMLATVARHFGWWFW